MSEEFGGERPGSRFWEAARYAAVMLRSGNRPITVGEMAAELLEVQKHFNCAITDLAYARDRVEAVRARVPVGISHGGALDEMTGALNGMNEWLHKLHKLAGWLPTANGMEEITLMGPKTPNISPELMYVVCKALTGNGGLTKQDQGLMIQFMKDCDHQKVEEKYNNPNQAGAFAAEPKL